VETSDAPRVQEDDHALGGELNWLPDRLAPRFSCDYCGEWIEDISKGNPHALYQKGDKEPSFVHQPCSRASVHSRGGQFHSWEPLSFFMARLLHNSKYDAERAEEGAKISGRL
jgi:hypothetical protein